MEKGTTTRPNRQRSYSACNSKLPRSYPTTHPFIVDGNNYFPQSRMSREPIRGRITVSRGFQPKGLPEPQASTEESARLSSADDLSSGDKAEDGGNKQENHAQRLSSFYRDLYQHAQLTDIKIKVGNYTFNAHRGVLACFSPFFANKVLHSGDSDLREIILDKTITPTGFKKILDYIYSRELTIEVEDLAEILQASNVLQIPELQERCLVLLHGAPCPALLEILEVSHKQDIRFACEDVVLQKLAANFLEVVSLEEFGELCPDCLFLILTRDDLVAQTEYQVAEGVIQWIRINPDDRLPVLTDLFSCVRLENMNSDEILRLGQDAPFLLHNETVRENILRAHWYKRTVEQGSSINVDDIDLPKPRKYVAGDGEDMCKQSPRQFPSVTVKPSQFQLPNRPSRNSLNPKDSKMHYLQQQQQQQQQQYAAYVMQAANKCVSAGDMYGYKPRLQPYYGPQGGPALPRYAKLYPDQGFYPEGSVPMVQQPRQWGDVTHNPWESMRPPREMNMDRPAATSHSYPIGMRNRENVVEQVPYSATERMFPQVQNEDVVVPKDSPIPQYILRIKKGHRHRVDKFPLTEHRWVSCNMALPADFSYACSVLVGEHLLFIGGLHHGDPHGDVWALDVRTDKWRQVAPLNVRRYMHGAVVLGNVVYVVGGIDEFGNALSDMECLSYTNEAQQWATQQPMPFGRYGAAVAADRDVIYVAGGMNQSPASSSLATGGILSSVAAYYVKYRTWDSIETMRVPRYRAAMAAHDHKLFVIGGIISLSDRVESSRDIDVWDGRRWSKVARMTRARYDCSTFVHSGHMYVFGGYEQSSALDTADSSSAAVSKDEEQVVEIFNLDLRKWAAQICLGPLLKDAKFAMIAGT